jgi:hypothetical protein
MPTNRRGGAQLVVVASLALSVMSAVTVFAATVRQHLLEAGFSEPLALLAVGFIAGQGFALWGVLLIYRSQREATRAHREWTEALTRSDESSRAIHQSFITEVRKLAALPNKEGAA